VKETKLFWNLSVETQAKLIQYQWDNFGSRINIPPEPKDIYIETSIEPLEELEQIMKQAPEHQRRVV